MISYTHYIILYILYTILYHILSIVYTQFGIIYQMPFSIIYQIPRAQGFFADPKNGWMQQKKELSSKENGKGPKSRV